MRCAALHGPQAAFVADDVSNIIKESIDAVLQNTQYSEAKVSQWTSSCLENCIKRLTALNKPFKYVVTCAIMQKNGAAARGGIVTEACMPVRSRLTSANARTCTGYACTRGCARA